MKKYIVWLLALAVCATLLLTGCSQESPDNGVIQDDATEAAKESPPPQSEGEADGIAAASDEDKNTESQESGSAGNNTYTTKLALPNVFAFDYPDGWSITEESISYDMDESVVLSSETGIKIYFRFMTYDYAYAPIALNTRVEADISKVADASFDSEAGCEGPYMVAKVTTLQTKYISYADGSETVYPIESPYEHYDYAVLPESCVGLDWHGYYDADSFNCGGVVQFRAGSVERLSPQEEQEVIDILASFRIGEPPEHSDEVSDPLLADLLNGDFSYFAGSYTVDEHIANMYSWYSEEIPDWTLYSNGESDGGWFLNNSGYTGAKPIRVTLNEDGSYECVIYEDNYSQMGELLDYMIVKEEFILYPPSAPDSFSMSSSDENKIRVRVISAHYGGVLDVTYQKN